MLLLYTLESMQWFYFPMYSLVFPVFVKNQEAKQRKTKQKTKKKNGIPAGVTKQNCKLTDNMFTYPFNVSANTKQSRSLKECDHNLSKETIKNGTEKYFVNE